VAKIALGAVAPLALSPRGCAYGWHITRQTSINPQRNSLIPLNETVKQAGSLLND